MENRLAQVFVLNITSTPTSSYVPVLPRDEIMVHTSILDVIATTTVGIMNRSSASTPRRSSKVSLGPKEGLVCTDVPQPTGGAEMEQDTRPMVDVVPGRLYSAHDLRRLLPPTLARIVIAQCRLIDGVVIGQAVIDLLTRAFVDQMETGSPHTSDQAKEPQLMTLEEAADYLRVSDRTIRRMVEAGSITAQNLARPGSKKDLLRFTREQLDRDMKKAETSPKTPPPSPRFRFAKF